MMQRRDELLKTRVIFKKIISYFRQLYIKIRYSGNEFNCPFCGGFFRKFLPAGMDFPVLKKKNIIGGGYRLNAVCPNCYSSDRERNIYLYLKNKTNLFHENISLLHVAPENMLGKILMMCPNIDYLSADLNSPTAMVKMDITNIESEDNSFDVIICNHVLEHIQNDLNAMPEIFRVLKPGGWAILQVPISLSLIETYEDPSITKPEEREKVFGQNDHVRIYAIDYKNRLEEVGFSIEMFNFTKEYGKLKSHKYGLLKDEDIYICSKQV